MMHSLALPFPQRQAHSEQQKPGSVCVSPGFFVVAVRNDPLDHLSPVWGSIPSAGEEWLRRCHMPGGPKECREHAKRCWALASEVTNPALKESLVETAQR